MPTLGSLLKKKRTRDSQGNPKELEPNSSQATETSTSHGAPAAESPANNNNNPPNANSSAAPPQPQTSNANQAADASMHQAVAHNQPAAQPNAGQNAASIQNLIHTPQLDSAGTQDHQHQPQIIRSDARSTKGKYSLEDFTLQRTLGTGSFGRVHLVQSKHNHRFYAIKVLKKAQVVKMKQIEHTNDERSMLNRVQHPFLVTLWGTWQDSRNLYMVMDFVEGGELFSLLRKSQVSVVRFRLGRVVSDIYFPDGSDSRTLSPSSMRPK